MPPCLKLFHVISLHKQKGKIVPAYDVTVSIQGNMPLNVKACRLNKGCRDTHGEDLQDLKSQDGQTYVCGITAVQNLL